MTWAEQVDPNLTIFDYRVGATHDIWVNSAFWGHKGPVQVPCPGPRLYRPSTSWPSSEQESGQRELNPQADGIMGRHGFPPTDGGACPHDVEQPQCGFAAPPSRGCEPLGGDHVVEQWGLEPCTDG